MYIDIDKAYAINLLLKIYEKFGENAYIRETEHGYHIRIPLDCSIDNFIYCLVLRREFDDKNRIAMDIVRLSTYDFPLAFDIVFDEKMTEGKKRKIKGKWYNLKEYLTLRGVI
jgi:hypothetical protein